MEFDDKSYFKFNNHLCRETELNEFAKDDQNILKQWYREHL